MFYTLHLGFGRFYVITIPQSLFFKPSLLPFCPLGLKPWVLHVLVAPNLLLLFILRQGLTDLLRMALDSLYRPGRPWICNPSASAFRMSWDSMLIKQTSFNKSQVLCLYKVGTSPFLLPAVSSHVGSVWLLKVCVTNVTRCSRRERCHHGPRLLQRQPLHSRSPWLLSCLLLISCSLCFRLSLSVGFRTCWFFFSNGCLLFLGLEFVCSCTHVQVHLCSHVNVCVKGKGQPWVLSCECCLPCFWDRVSHWAGFHWLD